MSARILIVDDDKEVREIVMFVLSRNGFEVVAAEDGRQLQRLLDICLKEEIGQLPDLIMLDVMMPGEDGYQICYNLRHDPATRHIPIIIITAHTEDIYQRISVDLGAIQHITKPFHPLALAEQVKGLLKMR